MRSNSEFSLVIINGLMHHYVDERWMIMGQSRIGIYHDTINNTFRIVGRKLDNYEVVANCAINESFCYNKATPSFHQWRDIIDEHRVYGVKFANVDEANLFGETIEKIVDSSEKMAKMVAMMNNSNINGNNTTTTSTTNNNSYLTGNEHQQQNGTFNTNYNNGFQQKHHFQTSCEQTPSLTIIPKPPPLPTTTGHLNNNNKMNGNNCQLDDNGYVDNNMDNATNILNHQITQQLTTLNNQDINKSEMIDVDEDSSTMANKTTNTNLNGNNNNNGNCNKPIIPPPTPPPIPPHLKIAPKPKISVKPESLINGMKNANTLKPTTTNGNVPSTNGGGMHPSKSTSNLIDEMAQTLAKRRAKIEEAENNSQQQNVNSLNVNGNDNRDNKTSNVPVPPPPPPLPSTTPIKCFTPVNSNIRRFNSVSNGSSTYNNGNHHHPFMNGSTTSLPNGHHHNGNHNGNGPNTKQLPLNHMNHQKNSQSMINICNGKSNQSSRAQSPITTCNTPISISSQQQERLKEDILMEIRQELNQFKQDLLNALRMEILPNLNSQTKY